MEKLVHLSFTGVSVVSPAYSARPAQRGEIRAVMPASPRARRASKSTVQINAQFAFAEFALRHLVESDTNRHPDFRFGPENAQRAICFLSAERLTLANKPVNDGVITYEENDPSYNPAGGGVPSISSRHAGWIANWNVFAAAGKPRLKDLSALQQSYIELILPGGHVSGAFRCDTPNISQAQFLYGDSKPQYYAHETVVTLRYPASTTNFVLRSQPLNGGRGTDLTFTWGDADAIEILLGNGSLESINNVMKGDYCGHDHRTLTDYEFECLHDVVDCERDEGGRLPVPRVHAREIRQIPCITSMIGTSSAEDRSREKTGSVRDFPGLGVLPPVDVPPLSAQDPLAGAIIVDALEDMRRQARAVNHMCRFVLGGRLLGTGFLFEEPDLVMTAAHLFFNADGSLINPVRAANIEVEFDVIKVDNGTIAVDGVKRTKLRLPDWAVNPQIGVDGAANREVNRLDYALIRLEEPVGNEEVGSATRGWFVMPAAGEVLLRENTPVRVLQHLDNAPLRSSIGVVRSFSADRLRVGYTASTLDGASGAAVLDAELRLVALHVAGEDEDFLRQNQGVPIRRIQSDINDRRDAPAEEVCARAS